MTTPAASPAEHDAGRTGVLFSMCLALVLVVASVSSVNLALTGISVDLGTTSSQLTWVADGYTVALAALVLPFGALGDRIGRRTLLLVGTAVFGIAALGAAAAQSPQALIGCRILMGLGAAMIMPGTLSTITAVFPSEKRARAVSVWAGFATSGAILGMLGCGLILEWSSWRATFVATSVLAVAAAVFLAPNTADPEEAVIDAPGFMLSAVGIGALIFGIVDGAEAGWTSPGALGGLLVAAVSLLTFVWWELRTDQPMLDVRLFALRGFGTGAVALTVQFLCLFGFFLVGLQFVQLILGYSALKSAICLLPMGAIVMPMSRVAPRLVDRFGSRAVMSVGLAGLATGLVVMSRLDATSSYGHFLGGLAVFGLGMALTSTPATTAIVTSLPKAKQGVASAVNDVSREIGSALGIAILGSLFNSGYRSAVSPATSALPTEAAHVVEESAGAGLAAAAHMGPSGRPVADAVSQAFVAGLQDAMVAGAVIAILAAAFTVWRAPRRAAERRDPAAGPARPARSQVSATRSPPERMARRPPAPAPPGLEDSPAVSEGSAKDVLHERLRGVRAAMVWKLDGLTELDARRPLTASGTNLLGLVKHLTSTETRYFGLVFDRPSPDPLPWWGDDGYEPFDDLWATAEESRAGIVDGYRRAWDHADATIAALDIDAPGHVPWWPRPDVTLLDVMVHVLTETNRHAGHADILREQLDGAVGTEEGSAWDLGPDFWEAHRAKVDHAAVTAAAASDPT